MVSHAPGPGGFFGQRDKQQIVRIFAEWPIFKQVWQSLSQEF